MAKNYEGRVFEVSQELDKISRNICFKYDDLKGEFYG